MTEVELLRRVKRKERSAQQELYSNYKSHWFVICLRYNKSREDAMDILQNALVNIFSKLYQFDEKKGDFKSWSSKIVVNENLMFLRKKTKAFRTEEIKSNDIYETNEASEPAGLSSEELTKMIQTLPEGYRMVFNLYVMDGYTHVEISEILNISIGSSKSQLSKARKFLQQKLEVLI